MIYIGSLISLVPGGLAFTSIRLLDGKNTLVMINGVINVVLVAVSLTAGLGIASLVINHIQNLKKIGKK